MPLRPRTLLDNLLVHSVDILQYQATAGVHRACRREPIVTTRRGWSELVCHRVMGCQRDELMLLRSTAQINQCLTSIHTMRASRAACSHPVALVALERTVCLGGWASFKPRAPGIGARTKQPHIMSVRSPLCSDIRLARPPHVHAP